MASKIRLEQIEPFTTGLGGGGGGTFYLGTIINDLLEDGNLHRHLSPVLSTAANGDLSTAAIGSGETKQIYVFSTPEFWPGVDVISAGTFKFYLTAWQTAGTREVTMHAELYKQNTAGTQTLLVETEETDVLGGSLTNYTLAVDGGPFLLGRTDRLVLKIFFTGGFAGTDATVTFRTKSIFKERIEIPLSEIKAGSELDSGWIPAAEDWTRTGNHTFLVAGDQSAIFRKGTKIRYKDGGSYEYGVVGSVSVSTNTTVTLITNSDFAMASATITDKFISYQENPAGWPGWFEYSVSWTTTGTAPAIVNGTLEGYWTVRGAAIFAKIRLIAGSSTTFGTGSWSFSIPINSVNHSSSVAIESAAGNILHASTRYAIAAFIRVADMRGIYQNQILGQGAPLTLVSGNVINLSCEYEY